MPSPEKDMERALAYAAANSFTYSTDLSTDSKEEKAPYKLPLHAELAAYEVLGSFVVGSMIGTGYGVFEARRRILKDLTSQLGSRVNSSSLLPLLRTNVPMVAWRLRFRGLHFGLFGTFWAGTDISLSHYYGKRDVWHTGAAGAGTALLFGCLNGEVRGGVRSGVLCFGLGLAVHQGVKSLWGLVEAQHED